MLFKKFLRDIWKNKIQFISIFIMAALSTYIYAGMGSLYKGLDKELEEYYKKTNFYDYMIYSKDGFNDIDLENLIKIKNINSVESRYVYDGAIALDYDNSNIVLNVVESNYSISKCIVIEGNHIDYSTNGIWLDYSYAKEKEIKVGESFTLSIEGKEVEYEVKGLVINPEYIYQVNADSIIPNHDDLGFAFVTYNSFENIVPIKSNVAVIDMKDKTKNGLFNTIFDNKESYFLKEDNVAEIIDSYDIFKTREDVIGHTMFNQAIEQYRAIGIVFPIAFLAVTILTMLTTITRLVDKQRVEIGTLGTLGLKKNKIYRHYISFGFFPALVGCLCGTILAPFTLPYTFYETLKTLYTMEKWKPSLTWSTVIMVVLCIGLCVLVSYSTVGKVLKETPAQAIKPKVSEELDNSTVLKSKMVEHMKFATKWNLIDLLKGKVRAIMTIVGIAGCIGLLIAGFGFRDSLERVVIDQYEKMYKFNTKLVLDSQIIALDDDKSVEEKINSEYTNLDYIYEGQIYIKSDFKETDNENNLYSKNNNKEKLTTLTVVNDIKNISYYNVKGDKISISDDGIIISRKIADVLGLEKGQQANIKLLGKKEFKSVNVVDIYVAPITQGIVISKNLFEDLGYMFIANYALTDDIVVNEKDISDKNLDYDKVFDNNIKGIIKFITKDKLRSDYEFTKKTLDSISIILMGSAIVLAIVVLYNLNMLSLYEKQKEFALLKVLGFKSARIRNLLLRQTVLLVTIGIIIGIPFGIGLLYVILNTMGESVDMTMSITPISHIIAIGLTFGISLIMNLVFIVNIKKIDMVSSLKNIE